MLLVPVYIFLCLLKILQNIKAFVNIKVFWCIFTYINNKHAILLYITVVKYVITIQYTNVTDQLQSDKPVPVI